MDEDFNKRISKGERALTKKSIKVEHLHATSIDDRGRIVIPNKIRDKMGIEKGDVLLVWLKDDCIFVQPPKNNFDIDLEESEEDEW